MLWLDHVVRIVRDFDATERRFRDRYGLTPGSWVRYPGSGVVSRLFVVGSGGIELLGIRDAAEATDHFLDRWVLSASSEGERWLGAAVATDALDLHADRLGLRPVPMSAVNPHGKELTWRLLGDPFRNAPPLPFFIEWGEEVDPWPREGAMLNSAFQGIKHVEAAGSPAAVAQHLGGEFDFILIAEGSPGIHAVILDSEHGEVRIE